MSSSLLLRLVVVVLLVALATEVHLISGLDLEETRGGPFEMERVSSSSSIGRSSFPQLYNLYMDPVRKGASSSSSLSFDVVHPDKGKRSRLFVGKRFNDDFLSDDEDLILVSDDNDDEPSSSFDNVLKRNHLFVGKRASPRFVGKRSAATNQPSRMTRRKRFASSEFGGRGDGKGMRVEDGSSDEGSRMWKLWMAAGTGEEEGSEEGNAAEKRARMFVGKRRQMEADDMKRARLFVGRRAEAEDEKDSGIALPAEEEEEGAAKRSRLFVGKRHPEEKEGETMHGSPPMAVAGGPTDDKRVHLFPGKRPAPGFVGKRED